jgi:seryl-tRNA synthetase
MLDIKFIRENPDLIKESARKKRIRFVVEDLLAAESRRVELLSVVEGMRAEQNTVSGEVARASDPAAREAMIFRMKELKETLGGKVEEL